MARRWRVAALLFAVLGMLLWVESPSRSPARGQEPTVTIAVFSGLPRVLDIFDQVGRYQADLENIYEPLVYPFQDTFEIRGVLAESWTSAEGGAIWTFKLRRNVRFHDGTELTAEAVKLSFERDRAVGRSTGSGLLTDVSDVRVVDPYTVQFAVRLAGGAPFLPRLTGLLIASAKALRDHAGDPAWFRTNAVGTGPYMVDQYVPRDRLVLRRFDRYWGQRPFFSRAVLLDIPEPATQALMIDRGQVDIAYRVPPESLARMKQNPELRVLQVPGDRVLNLRLNVSHGVFTKPALRKALAYAMDYEALARALSEQVSLTEGPVPGRYMRGWIPPNLIRKQNLDRARQLLSEAGLSGQLAATITYSTGSPQTITAVEVLQESLRKIGVNARLNGVDFTPTFQKLQRFARTKNPADAEDTMSLVRGPFVPHPYAYFSSYEPGGQWNFMDYQNKRVQELFDLGYAVERRDPDRAQEYYRQGVQMIVDDQPDIWLHVEKKVVVLRSNIRAYYTHPIWYPETHVFPLSRR